MNIRVNIVVEGQTEEGFVKQVLAPYLGAMNIFCTARSVETSRSRRKHKIYRGGMVDYLHLKRDLERWMKQDDHPEAFFSTMIDLYRLPPEFPAYEETRKASDPFARVACLEDAFEKEMKHSRFIPYIQLHEFEALLLCDPQYFIQHYPTRTKEVAELTETCAGFESPDLIDDGASTAPSKRIIEKIPEYEYEKPVDGPAIAKDIGIEGLRKCRHFSEWVGKLQGLAHS